MDMFNEFDARAVIEKSLSTLQKKAHLYAQEPSFREGLAEISRFGPSAVQAIRDVGIAVLRPDAIIDGKANLALQYWARLGLRITGAFRTRVNHDSIREIWRYQLNVATGPRIALLDCLFQTADSVVVVLRKSDTALRLPTAVILAESKGSSVPSARAGWELRSFLESPSRLHSYVHTPDEPADVVRDLVSLVGSHRVSDVLNLDDTVSRSSIVDLCGDAAHDREVGSSLPGGLQSTPDYFYIRRLLEVGCDPWEVFGYYSARIPTSHHDETLINDSGGLGWWAASSQRLEEMINMVRTREPVNELQ